MECPFLKADGKPLCLLNMHDPTQKCDDYASCDEYLEYKAAIAKIQG